MALMPKRGDVWLVDLGMVAKVRPCLVRYDFDQLTASVLDNSLPDRPHEPLLAIDECLNHPVVKSAVALACNEGLAIGADPLWNQRRVREDGSVCYVWGGVPRGFKAPFDVGKPEKHAVWDDQSVVYCLVAKLIQSNVVLLTENIRFDEFGVRKLLRDVVAPKLQDTVSLTALFKSGRTSYSDYCDRVIDALRLRAFAGGYAEYLL
jgi:hypothetical protein